MQSIQRKARTKFYFLLCIFILPMILSGFLFHFHQYFHFKTTQHGTLIYPTVQLSPENLRKWQIIYISSNPQDAFCQKLTYQLFQLQKALGKDHNRVKVIVQQEWKSLYQALKPCAGETFTTSHGTSLCLKQQSIILGGDFQHTFIVSDKIYLVDPLGNLFMYYPSTINPMHILKDLKKVLGASQIG